MVRRWSCINELNIDSGIYKRFHVVRRLRIFRDVLKFKRFWNKGTKFKRIGMMRLHHRANWLIYLNILKYWIEDFRFSRHHTRFQYFNRFFINNYIIFDANYIKKQQLKIIIRQDQWVSAALTRRFFWSIGRYGNAKIINTYKSANHVHAFFPENDLIPNIKTIPIISVFELDVFGINSDLQIENECDDITQLISNILLSQHIELYKIFVLLFYQKIRVIK